MLIMPSNFAFATKEFLALMLLKIMPEKVQQIVSDITSNVQIRTKPFLLDLIISKLGEIETPAARIFGKHIQVSDKCSGCGWCCTHCPSGNIIMRSDKPHFQNKCHLCLKCIYGCPKQALSPGLGKFIIIKNGYDLTKMQNKISLIPQNVTIEEQAKGYLWKGVRLYLLEK